MGETETLVESFYGGRAVLPRIEAALAQAGIDPEKFSYRDLWRFDQLHGRGIAATREHADRAGLRAGMQVLDLGCGIGGPSRYLAAERDCRVTAVDLTPEYVETARVLTARCGLADRIAFHQASALALPFPDGVFDHVWCHNVTMNIADKIGLARQVARVLRPGGRFSCVEVAQGAAGLLRFPLPWAADAASSFLVTPAAMRAALEAGGLRIIEQHDDTQAYLAAARETAKRVASGETAPQSNEVVSGEDFPVRFRNRVTGMAEGRLVEQFILAEKP
jgi:ubiquinone/menaquinone biosynthesis C-methylase UbiE